MGKLVVLMITAFVDMVGLVMVLPLLPFYATEFGATASMVGLLVSSFSVAQLVVAPAWGRFSDRYGRRPAIITGLLISAAAYVVFAYASTVWLLLLSRIVQGLGGGTVAVVQAYVTDVSDPKDRAKALGWLSAATSVGAVVGPALGSFLVRVGGHTAPGLASAVLCVLVAAFAHRYLRESRGARLSGQMHVVSPMTGREAILRVISHSGEPAPRLIWIYAVAIGAFYGTTPILPLLLADRFPVTEQNVGYFIMYLGGMGVVVRAGILGWVLDRLGEARLARLGIVLLAAGLATLSVTYTYPMLALSLTLMPLGTAFTFPCISALLSRVVPRGERGLYLGVQHTFGGVSRVAFPVGAGLLMDSFGRAVPFTIAGLLVLATLLLTSSLEDYARVDVAAAGG
jgi:multidrug resistance protein